MPIINTSYAGTSSMLPARPHPSAQPQVYRKRLLLLILGIALLKCLVAFTVDLGNDEAYYWLYSQHLQANYFDHPPMVSFWVRIFTGNLQLQAYAGFVRLGSIVGCALATYFIFRTGATLHSEKVGWIAACLYNASFYAGITAGLFIMPDAPQMVFWTFSLWMIARLSMGKEQWATWLLLGIAAGLCIMSKVHGAFIWIGLGLFALFYKRTWLQRPRFYVAALLTVLIASPILFWNIQNEFVTYRFHSQRVTIQALSLNGYSFVKELFSQLFFNNPFNVALILTAVVAWYRRRMPRLPALTIFHFIAWPLALLLLAVSIFRDTTLPHWSGPAYITLLPLAAVQLTALPHPLVRRRWRRWSLGAFVLVVVTLTAAVQFYPGTFGNRNTTVLGRGDNTLDLYGWKEAGKQFAALYRQEQAAGIMPAGAPVVCYKWWGAHIEYYFCQPQGIAMIGLGTMHNLHEYMWMNGRRANSVDFTRAYCIVPSDEYYDVQQQYAPYYHRMEPVTTIAIKRSGRPAHNFTVYRLQGWKNNLPVAY